MKATKIQNDDINVHIDCPHCDNWEQLGVDDPRHRFSNLAIIKWLPDVEGEHEKSIHECSQCKNEFKVVWDYDNPITTVTH